MPSANLLLMKPVSAGFRSHWMKDGEGWSLFIVLPFSSTLVPLVPGFADFCGRIYFPKVPWLTPHASVMFY